MKRFFRRLLNLFFPRTCAACGKDVPLEAAHAVCGGCWDALPRWTGLSCRVCGVPLPDGGARCRECRKRRRGVTFVRSGGVYEGTLKKLVTAFKYQGRQDLARPLTDLLREAWAAEEGLGPVDVVVPVPLHWRRERRRGFNQAALLAESFGRGEGLPVLDGVLKRAVPGVSQTGLGREARRDNVRGAFTVRKDGSVKGKAVLLVDDVCTTGATVEACARVLKSAGARRVGALTVARQVTF